MTKVREIKSKMLKKCVCGAGKPIMEEDVVTEAIFIECLSCGRVVAGLHAPEEAIKMWNAAMDVLKLESGGTI